MNKVFSIPLRFKAAALFIALIVLSWDASAYIATLSTTGVYGVDTAISITKNSDINFGKVKAGVSDTYTISTAGAVSHAGAGVELYGTTSAASLTIVGSTTQTINTSVGSYTANNGVTPSSATCAYNGGGSGSCSQSGLAAPGAGKTLLVGVSVAVNGTQSAGTSAAPTFIIGVVYP